MSTKFLKRAALIAAVLIMLCSIFCINAFATGGDLPEPQEPETQQEEPQPPEITEEQHTESITIEIIPIEPVTSSEPKPTQAPKPTQTTTKPEPKPTQTQKPDPKPTQAREPEVPVEEEPQNQQPVNNGGQNENRNPDNDTAGKTTTSTTAAVTEGTTQSLTNPDGTFYAYIELNNGLKRMKHRMSEPDYLPEPDIPERKGFNFEGWYADPEFKKKWDFEKDIAKPGCILYAKWEDDGTDKTVYSITVTNSAGGKIEVNPTKAQPGETINITVTPDEGMRLKSGGLKVNGKSTDIFSFEMTSGNVKITAEFEAVSNQISVGKKANTVVIILIVLFVLLLAFAAFMFMRRRRAGADEEDDEGDSWVDTSVVVENGFKNGGKVAKSESDDDEDEVEVELVSLDDINSEGEQQPESEEDADGE